MWHILKALSQRVRNLLASFFSAKNKDSLSPPVAGEIYSGDSGAVLGWGELVAYTLPTKEFQGEDGKLQRFVSHVPDDVSEMELHRVLVPPELLAEGSNVGNIRFESHCRKIKIMVQRAYVAAARPSERAAAVFVADSLGSEEIIKPFGHDILLRSRHVPEGTVDYVRFRFAGDKG